MLLHDLRTITVLIKKVCLTFFKSQYKHLRDAAGCTAMHEGNIYIIIIIIIVDCIIYSQVFTPN